MAFTTPLRCPWQCHEIGGPWIAENPDCPFHSENATPDEITDETGLRLCRDENIRREAEEMAEAERRRNETFLDGEP